MQRKGWAVAAVGILLILGAIGIAWLNPQLTHYIESDRFRAELEKETAKRSAFPSGTLRADSSQRFSRHSGEPFSS